MTASSSPNVIVRRNPWQTLWRLATGDALLTTGILGLAVLLAAATFLPQSPQGDPAAFARWLYGAQQRFGGATGVLSGLGMFDVVHSLMFRGVAGLLGLAIAARLMDRVLDFRAASRAAPPPDSPGRSLSTARGPGEIMRIVRGYRVVRSESYTVVDRYPWSHIAAIAAHTGLLVMLAGLALSSAADWRVDGLSVLPDSPIAVPNTPYTVEASAVQANGEVSMALRDGARVLMQGSAAPGRPLLGSPAAFFVQDVLPALRAAGLDAEGKTLGLQSSTLGQPSGSLLLAFGADQRDEFFAAPTTNAAMRVSLVDEGPDPRYRVTVFSSATARQIVDETFSPPAQITAGEIRLQFWPESHAIVSAVHAPSLILTLAGLAVGLVGLAVVAVRPPLRIWLVTHKSGARLVCDNPDIDLGRLAGEEAER